MYIPAQNRYQTMEYRRCGASGIHLPALSLGLWHNFGNITHFQTQQALLRTAFDNGITHFDLANNYGPPYGQAQRNFGIHMDRDWKMYRDELFLSTKAGYDMWPGPYGDHGSRKYLIASINQSLKRMHVDYVDVFYHHRPDPDTPMEETASALDYIVRSGKALYVGISNYNPEQSKQMLHLLKELGTPCLVHQTRYSLLHRNMEEGLTDVLRSEKVGAVVFSPLHRGLLTGKYQHSIPADSRAARDPRYLKPSGIMQSDLKKIDTLQTIANERGQSLTHMALQWVLRDSVVTSAIIGASKPEQILDNLKALNGAPFTEEELKKINQAVQNSEE